MTESDEFPPDHWWGSWPAAEPERWSLLARLADLYGRWIKHWRAA